MRRMLCLLLFLAVSAGAQDFALTTPVTRTSIAKVKVDTFAFDRGGLTVKIGLVYQDSGNADIPAPALLSSLTIPSAAGEPCTSATTLNGIAGAMNVARSGEPAGAAARQQFRILGYLVDQGCFPAGSLNP